MSTASEKRAWLSRRLAEPGLVVAPGIFDLIPKIADEHGFDAHYMTGYARATDNSTDSDVPLAEFADLNRLVGFPDICAFDERYASLGRRAR
jgi:2-methylisocitrate lyase-like PEP mutase family enzyme